IGNSYVLSECHLKAMEIRVGPIRPPRQTLKLWLEQNEAAVLVGNGRVPRTWDSSRRRVRVYVEQRARPRLAGSTDAERIKRLRRRKVCVARGLREFGCQKCRHIREHIVKERNRLNRSDLRHVRWTYARTF